MPTKELPFTDRKISERSHFHEQQERTSANVLRRLTDWSDGRRVEQFDRDAVTVAREFKVIAYEQETFLSESLKNILQTHPVYVWYRKFPEEFLESVNKRPQFRRALRAVEEILALFDTQPDQTHLFELWSLALTQKVIEFALLVTPLVPQYIHHPIKESGVFSLEKLEEYLRQRELAQLEDEKLIYDLRNKREFPISLEELYFLLSLQIGRVLDMLPDNPLGFWGRNGSGKNGKNGNREGGNGSGNGKGSSKEKRPKRRRVNSRGLYRSPLLVESSVSGEERRWPQARKNQHMVLIDTLKAGETDRFVITKLWNGYNPETGELTVESSMDTVSYGDTDSEIFLTIPLGHIDVTKQTQITIPTYATSSSERKDFWTGRKLVSVRLENEFRRKDAISFKQLDLALSEDDAGNIYLDMKELGTEVIEWLSNRKVVMVAEYGGFASSPLAAIETIRAMSPEEQSYRLSLYPPTIQRLIRTLQNEKQKGLENGQIFLVLAQFLASAWLTYDEFDVPHSPRDPVGWNQTERVLHKRIASCEGSNIALGQLMRFFLEKDEGILYAQGYEVNGASEAYPGDAHLKIVYVKNSKARSFYDATAWSDEDKEYFSDKRKQYRQARQEWWFVNNNLGIPTEVRTKNEEAAYESWESLKNVWDPTDLQSTISKDLAAQLPGRRFSPEYIFAEDENGRRETNLIAFLKNVCGVDEYRQSYWVHPVDLSFNARFVIEYLGQSRFLKTAKHPAGFFSADDIRFMENHTKRQNAYLRMGTVISRGKEASEQNIAVFRRLTEVFCMARTDIYAQLARVLTESAIPLSEADIDTFLSKAPFMLLFPNPVGRLINALNRISNGFFSPGVDDLDAFLLQRLNAWTDDINSILTKIRDIIPKVPLKERKQEIKDQLVSSLFLWEGISELKKVERDELTRRPTYLFPDKLFTHLCLKLYAHTQFAFPQGVVQEFHLESLLTAIDEKGGDQIEFSEEKEE